MKKKNLNAILVLIAVLIAGVLACGCSDSGEFDKESLASIEGSYRVLGTEEISSEFAMDITDKELSIYDVGAGNPGISGKITQISADSLTIKLEYFENDPALYWVNDGKTMTVSYEKTDRGIVLTNNDYPITFKSDQADEVYCYLWKSDSEHAVKKFSFYEGGYEFEGWYYDIDRGWIDEGCPCGVISEETCKYYDDVVSHGEISKDEFEKLLQGDVENVVIQAVMPYESGVTEIRLVDMGVSYLVD